MSTTTSAQVARRYQQESSHAPNVSGPRRQSQFEHYLTRPNLRLGPILFSAVIATVLILAWTQRNEGYLAAESGIGYWLGIAGTSIMLLLLLYPMRKRYKVLHNVGRVANWFRAHMVLGILGPTLVILHTNFNLGSLNSRLALVTMLIVVASGVVGRYLYAKVHKGLYGRQAELRDVAADVAALKLDIGRTLGSSEQLTAELDRFDATITPSRSLLASSLAAVAAGGKARRSRRMMMRTVRKHLSDTPEWGRASFLARRHTLSSLDHQFKIVFAAVRKAERLAFFERLFGLWHHLHVPLFSMLVITVVIHVIAVHRY